MMAISLSAMWSETVISQDTKPSSGEKKQDGELAESGEKKPENCAVAVGGQIKLKMKSNKTIVQVFNSRPLTVTIEADKANPAQVIVTGTVCGTSRFELVDIDRGSEVFEVEVVVEKPKPEEKKPKPDEKKQ